MYRPEFDLDIFRIQIQGFKIWANLFFIIAYCEYIIIIIIKSILLSLGVQKYSKNIDAISKF